MSEFRFIDLKNTDADEALSLMDDLLEMDADEVAENLGVNMPAFTVFGVELAQQLGQETDDQEAFDAFLCGYSVCMSIIWNRLEVLSVNLGTVAAGRAAQAQETLRDVTLSRLSTIGNEIFGEMLKEEELGITDGNGSPYLQTVAEEYEGLSVLPDYIADDWLAETHGTRERADTVRAGSIFCIALLRELEVATEIEQLLGQQ